MFVVARGIVCALLIVCSVPCRAAEPATLRVSVIPTSVLAPLYAGIKYGYFKEEGLNIDLAPTAGGAIGIPGLVGGSYDIAFSNNVSALSAVAQGIDVQLLAPFPEGAADETAVIARKGEGIKTGRDLAGKTVAVNTNRNVIWLYVREWIRKTGGDPAQVTFREVAFPQMIDALKQKQIDAAFQINVFVIAAGKDPALEIVSFPYREVQPKVQPSQFLATRKFIEGNKDKVARFLKALKRGNEWFDAHIGKDELFSLVAEFTKLPEAVVREMKFQPVAKKVDADELEKTRDLMKREGLLKADVDVKKMIYAE
ncbi:ABC transporter substrate-binding protein [Bradyrhizobium lablabi]|uniref:ABC transporter substrate-binding protein n=1 Tax=Bradyrhizobium lablabi TaxID=722472 RepID=UPI001BA6CB45|nr:ABC transporter substrate-binding protein [Bradyrhizobium lablabi]MBR1119970.1 ABC transporter substrate-binding protein [Bradyrhizobium lablabi]